MTRRWLLAAATALSTLLLLTPSPSEACSRLALSNAVGFTTLPRDGQEVPANTRIWHVQPSTSPPALVLLDASGAEVAVTTTLVSLGGEAQESLAILTPKSVLAPGPFELQAGGVRVASFTVTVQVDETPPSVLSPSLTDASGSYFGAYSCGAPSLAVVGFDADAELVLALAQGQSWPSNAVLGAATGRTATLANVPAGEQHLSFVHLDLSGNATPSGGVDLIVPMGQSGCSAAAGWSLGLPLLLALRRRRQP